MIFNNHEYNPIVNHPMDNLINVEMFPMNEIVFKIAPV